MFGPGFAGFWLMPLVWVGQAIVVVWLAGHAVAPGTCSRGHQPLDTHEEQSARSEIDREEFHRRRAELTKT